MGDFPKFTGKPPDWVTFYEKFSAVFKIQGLFLLLEEDLDHEENLHKMKPTVLSVLLYILYQITAVWEDTPYQK